MIVLEPPWASAAMMADRSEMWPAGILAVMEVDRHRIEGRVDPEGRKLQPLLECFQSRTRPHGLANRIPGSIAATK